MRRTATRSAAMHERYDGLQGFDGRFGQDPVAEVEDVTGPASRAPQDVSHPGFERRARREERGRVQVPLEGGARSGPMRSQAWASGIRQSTPITSPPAAAKSSSSPAVSVPKWMIGTPPWA